MRMILLPLCLSLSLPALAGPGDVQSTQILDTAVAQFTGVPVGQEGGARTTVDPRLRLASCQLPQLEWFTPARDTVVVRCMAPAWRIFVPVNRSQPVQQPVAATSSPGMAGRPAPESKAEPVIKRGDAVRVQAMSSGFAISRDGVAMGDAAVGGRVLIRVDDKKPPIQAVAVEPGVATLPGWSR
ncbi:flagella basal body P-ring formation protein FlgA [Sphingomonas sp. BGYR3]|uniref:flagella basal body P-ring formation protein FlgA n=1 Tax=Sphingomonas sp. BGYR3 TaxID=2975483 RepID=UPI0021A687FB|nr:flagella basal body P-ring formation protein FlgA [Sphingomonas sp. BGYR3]MDG5488982.1 flagella basal body P-ring formation protein FlgA [Sphingomonas sp. BGYR3]